MYTVELDVSYECPHEEIEKLASEHNCTAKMIQEFGPGGGNPVYQFSSETFYFVEELIQDFFGGEHSFDEEEINNMIFEV